MKKIVTVIAGILVFALAFAAVQRLLMPKYQTGTIEGSMIEEYYKSEEPHEVIFLGDCEVYENISPVTLYENYGISSYIRGSAEQYIWQSYYILRDTLRTETPRVVVLSVHSLQFDQPRTEEYNRMTLDGMRWSSDKVNAIKASMMADEHFVDYVFPILRYHYRWSELGSDDIQHFFTKDQVTVNGYYMRCDVRPYEGFPPKPPLVDYTLGGNALRYLSKIDKLCKDNGIQLMLIKAPIEYPFWYEQWDSQIQVFADERGIPYINYIGNEEIGIDWQQDTYDAGLHFNITGAEKFADHLGAYLDSTYELTDYRNDPAVSARWEENIRLYNEMRDSQNAEIQQYGHLVRFGANATN